jgi:hypothetical protein
MGALGIEVHDVAPLGDVIEHQIATVGHLNVKAPGLEVVTLLRQLHDRDGQLVIVHGIGMTVQEPTTAWVELKRQPGGATVLWFDSQEALGRNPTEPILQVVHRSENRKQIEHILVPGEKHELMETPLDVRSRIRSVHPMKIWRPCLDSLVVWQ